MSQKDKFGRHEILDRTHLVMDSIEDWLINHKGLKQDERKLAIDASNILFDLYQLVGKRHLLEPKKKKKK